MYFRHTNTPHHIVAVSQTSFPVLFVTGDSREPDDGKGRALVEANQQEEAVWFVNVTVDLLGEDRETVVGLENWSFPYAFEDDRWVFTDFRLVS